jgi:hypothetical protein
MVLEVAGCQIDMQKSIFGLIEVLFLEVVFEQFGKNFFFRGTFVELLGLVFNKLCINMGTSWEKLLKMWEKVLGKRVGNYQKSKRNY